jgi:hypothetical protein
MLIDKIEVELGPLIEQAVATMAAESGLPVHVVRSMVNMEAARGGRASIQLLIGTPAKAAR